MASPEAIFEREAVRSYMVADLWVALGHDITDPRIAGQGVDLIRLWADLMAEVRSLRPADEPDHEVRLPARRHRFRAALLRVPCLWHALGEGQVHDRQGGVPVMAPHVPRDGRPHESRAKERATGLTCS